MIKRITKSRQTIQLFFGIVLSAFVLIQAVHAESGWQEAQEHSDQTDSETGSDASVSLPQTIPNSVSQINLAFDSYLLDEVTFSTGTDERKTSAALIAPRVHRAIRVLLRKIISPNAP